MGKEQISQYKSKVKLSLCKGSNSGTAIYLQDESGGYRVAGSKCWGFIQDINSFDLGEDDLTSLINEARKLRKEIKASKKKWFKNLTKLLDEDSLEIDFDDYHWKQQFLIGNTPGQAIENANTGEA